MSFVFVGWRQVVMVVLLYLSFSPVVEITAAIFNLFWYCDNPNRLDGK